MIYYFTPFIKNNLGRAYNHYCDLVPNDDDWITFTDGDIMQLHTNWGDLWQEILNNNKNAGIITCMTNRAWPNNHDQVCIDMFHETDILKHKIYANKILNENRSKVKNMTGSFLSGYFFSFTKETWKKVGGFSSGILDVDKNFYNKVRSIKSCIVAQDFYVLHYYRMIEGHNFKDHLNSNNLKIFN
jgi:hypothetical protein